MFNFYTECIICLHVKNSNNEYEDEEQQTNTTDCGIQVHIRPSLRNIRIQVTPVKKTFKDKGIMI